MGRLEGQRVGALDTLYTAPWRTDLCWLLLSITFAPQSAHAHGRCTATSSRRPNRHQRGSCAAPSSILHAVNRLSSPRTPCCATNCSSYSAASNGPAAPPADRALLVLLASRLPTWRHALLIVQPQTVLRWHRQLFRLWWRRKSRAIAPAHRPPLATETIALIREMAAANRTWGAERIRGELLKLDIRVAKSTIQKYLRDARPPRPQPDLGHLPAQPRTRDLGRRFPAGDRPALSAALRLLPD